MTDAQTIPHRASRDDPGIFILDLVETNERLERENVGLWQDLRTLRDILRGSMDLNHKYRDENLKLRAYIKQLRLVPDRRAAA